MPPPPIPAEAPAKDTYDVLPPPELPNVSVNSTTKPKASTDRKFPCVECGARMEYDPEAKALKCPYCGYVQKAPEKQEGKVVERDYETYLRRLQKHSKKEKIAADAPREVRCTGCGAMVTLGEKDIVEQCPYCHTHLEKLDTKDEEVIVPESVLPFSISQRDAIKHFTDWVNSRWFAPNALRNLANLGQFTGIYLPYFTYDAMTHTVYEGRRGVTYTETERDSEGNTRSVTRVDWTWCSGQFEHFFDDILVCSSKRLPPDLIRELTPWDLEHLAPFNSDFLSGFKAERYTIEMPEGFAMARDYMENVLVSLTRRDIGGDQQQIINRNSDYTGISFKHLLLPIWQAQYRYGEKTYPILVNGRTGEVQGYRPYSVWKIIRLVAMILAIVGMIIYFTSGKKGGRRGGGPQNGPNANQMFR